MVQSLRPLLTRNVIEQLEHRRCIVRLGIGYDNSDVAAATERGGDVYAFRANGVDAPGVRKHSQGDGNVLAVTVS